MESRGTGKIDRKEIREERVRGGSCGNIEDLWKRKREKEERKERKEEEKVFNMSNKMVRSLKAESIGKRGKGRERKRGRIEGNIRGDKRVERV